MSGSEHQDFIDGYMDGRNLDCPEPNENRSEKYKHSFMIGRSEISRKIIPAKKSRVLAEAACKNDDMR